MRLLGYALMIGQWNVFLIVMIEMIDLWNVFLAHLQSTLRAEPFRGVLGGLGLGLDLDTG